MEMQVTAVGGDLSHSHGFGKASFLLEPQGATERIVESASTASSQAGAEFFSVCSLDMSAESVGDVDEVMSKESIGETNELGPSIVTCKGALVRSGSENSMVTTEPLFKTDKGRRNESFSWTWRNESCNTMGESSEMYWTDDKHSSYLNSIEASFVRNMYDREYCAVDLCREAPQSSEQDCVESRPAETEFKTWQQGGWCPVAFIRPLLSQLPTFTPPPVLRNPWVKHFRSTGHGRRQVGGVMPVRSPSASNPGQNTKVGGVSSLRLSSGKTTISRSDQPPQEVVDESVVLNTEEDRLQCHLNTSSSFSPKKKQGRSSPKKKQEFPPNRRGSPCGYGGISKQLSNKLSLGKMDFQLHEMSFHEPQSLQSCESHLQQEHLQPTNQNSSLFLDPCVPSSKQEIWPVLEKILVKEGKGGSGTQSMQAHSICALGDGRCIVKNSDRVDLAKENMKTGDKRGHAVISRISFGTNFSRSSMSPGINLEFNDTTQKSPHSKICKWGVLGIRQQVHVESGKTVGAESNVKSLCQRAHVENCI